MNDSVTPAPTRNTANLIILVSRLEDNQIPLAEAALTALLAAREEGKVKYPGDRWQDVLPSDNWVHLNAHASEVRNPTPTQSYEEWYEHVSHLIWRACLALKIGR